MIKVGSKVKVLDSEGNRCHPYYSTLIGKVLTVREMDRWDTKLLRFEEEGVRGMSASRVKEIQQSLENK